MLQSLFNKATGLRACSFVEWRFQHWWFSFVICETFESTYFHEYLATAASDSLSFDILLGQFLYSGFFVIYIYLNCVTNQSFSKSYLLFNVRNIFLLIYFTLLHSASYAILRVWLKSFNPRKLMQSNFGFISGHKDTNIKVFYVFLFFCHLNFLEVILNEKVLQIHL